MGDSALTIKKVSVKIEGESTAGERIAPPNVIGETISGESAERVAHIHICDRRMCVVLDSPIGLKMSGEST